MQTTFPMDPRGVALMIRVAEYFHANFARTTGESSIRIHRMATGRVQPSPSVMRYLNLEKHGKNYTWRAL